MVLSTLSTSFTMTGKRGGKRGRPPKRPNASRNEENIPPGLQYPLPGVPSSSTGYSLSHNQQPLYRYLPSQLDPMFVQPSILRGSQRKTLEPNSSRASDSNTSSDLSRPSLDGGSQNVIHMSYMPSSSHAKGKRSLPYPVPVSDAGINNQQSNLLSNNESNTTGQQLYLPPVSDTQNISQQSIPHSSTSKRMRSLTYPPPSNDPNSVNQHPHLPYDNRLNIIDQQLHLPPIGAKQKITLHSVPRHAEDSEIFTLPSSLHHASGSVQPSYQLHNPHASGSDISLHQPPVTDFVLSQQLYPLPNTELSLSNQLSHPYPVDSYSNLSLRPIPAERITSVIQQLHVPAENSGDAVSKQFKTPPVGGRGLVQQLNPTGSSTVSQDFHPASSSNMNQQIEPTQPGDLHSVSQLPVSLVSDSHIISQQIQSQTVTEANNFSQHIPPPFAYQPVLMVRERSAQLPMSDEQNQSAVHPVHPDSSSQQPFNQHTPFTICRQACCAFHIYAPPQHEPMVMHHHPPFPESRDETRVYFPSNLHPNSSQPLNPNSSQPLNPNSSQPLNPNSSQQLPVSQQNPVDSETNSADSPQPPDTTSHQNSFSSHITVPRPSESQSSSNSSPRPIDLTLKSTLQTHPPSQMSGKSFESSESMLSIQLSAAISHNSVITDKLVRREKPIITHSNIVSEVQPSTSYKIQSVMQSPYISDLINDSRKDSAQYLQDILTSSAEQQLLIRNHESINENVIDESNAYNYQNLSSSEAQPILIRHQPISNDSTRTASDYLSPVISFNPSDLKQPQRRQNESNLSTIVKKRLHESIAKRSSPLADESSKHAHNIQIIKQLEAQGIEVFPVSNEDMVAAAPESHCPSYLEISLINPGPLSHHLVSENQQSASLGPERSTFTEKQSFSENAHKKTLPDFAKASDEHPPSTSGQNSFSNHLPTPSGEQLSTSKQQPLVFNQQGMQEGIKGSADKYQLSSQSHEQQFSHSEKKSSISGFAASPFGYQANLKLQQFVQVEQTPPSAEYQSSLITQQSLSHLDVCEKHSPPPEEMFLSAELVVHMRQPAMLRSLNAHQELSQSGYQSSFENQHNLNRRQPITIKPFSSRVMESSVQHEESAYRGYQSHQDDQLSRHELQSSTQYQSSVHDHQSSFSRRQSSPVASQICHSKTESSPVQHKASHCMQTAPVMHGNFVDEKQSCPVALGPSAVGQDINTDSKNLVTQQLANADKPSFYAQPRHLAEQQSSSQNFPFIFDRKLPYTENKLYTTILLDERGKMGTQQISVSSDTSIPVQQFSSCVNQSASTGHQYLSDGDQASYSNQFPVAKHKLSPDKHLLLVAQQQAVSPVTDKSINSEPRLLSTKKVSLPLDKQGMSSVKDQQSPQREGLTSPDLHLLPRLRHKTLHFKCQLYPKEEGTPECEAKIREKIPCPSEEFVVSRNDYIFNEQSTANNLPSVKLPHASSASCPSFPGEDQLSPDKQKSVQKQFQSPQSIHHLPSNYAGNKPLQAEHQPSLSTGQLSQAERLLLDKYQSSQTEYPSLLSGHTSHHVGHSSSDHQSYPEVHHSSFAGDQSYSEGNPLAQLSLEKSPAGYHYIPARDHSSPAAFQSSSNRKMLPSLKNLAVSPGQQLISVERPTSPVRKLSFGEHLLVSIKHNEQSGAYSSSVNVESQDEQQQSLSDTNESAAGSSNNKVNSISSYYRDKLSPSTKTLASAETPARTIDCQSFSEHPFSPQGEIFRDQIQNTDVHGHSLFRDPQSSINEESSSSAYNFRERRKNVSHHSYPSESWVLSPLKISSSETKLPSEFEIHPLHTSSSNQCNLVANDSELTTANQLIPYDQALTDEKASETSESDVRKKKFHQGKYTALCCTNEAGSKKTRLFPFSDVLKPSAQVNLVTSDKRILSYAQHKPVSSFKHTKRINKENAFFTKQKQLGIVRSKKCPAKKFKKSAAQNPVSSSAKRSRVYSKHLPSPYGKNEAKAQVNFAGYKIATSALRKTSLMKEGSASPEYHTNSSAENLPSTSKDSLSSSKFKHSLNTKAKHLAKKDKTSVAGRTCSSPTLYEGKSLVSKRRLQRSELKPSTKKKVTFAENEKFSGIHKHIPVSHKQSVLHKHLFKEKENFAVYKSLGAKKPSSIRKSSSVVGKRLQKACYSRTVLKHNYIEPSSPSLEDNLMDDEFLSIMDIPINYSTSSDYFPYLYAFIPNGNHKFIPDPYPDLMKEGMKHQTRNVVTTINYCNNISITNEDRTCGTFLDFSSASRTSGDNAAAPHYPCQVKNEVQNRVKMQFQVRPRNPIEHIQTEESWFSEVYRNYLDFMQCLPVTDASLPDQIDWTSEEYRPLRKE